METLLTAIRAAAKSSHLPLGDADLWQLAEQLSAFPVEQVMSALRRCRREGCKRLTLNEVLSRVDDGRPGAEEAWLLVPKADADSTVWTTEMAHAFAYSVAALHDGAAVDEAKAAFKERYAELVAHARQVGIAPVWEARLGVDANGHEQALLTAVANGRISTATAVGLCPALRARMAPAGPALTDLMPARRFGVVQ
jgi:hypothetical protein